ncbi:hypothetical protein chiPu_0029314 [Chiloscyllium punctatum]|uniref:Uncharacterized protein n=1 Tax=Chiloscyllium punctatum TaxID=137246 RepID=A0A401TRZ1_CHIPU|nr:hypothetical protein [Chiloscyllium punctatum]
MADLERATKTAAGRRLELRQRQRRTRDIGAEQRGPREHRERVHRHVAAGHADLVGDVVIQDIRMHRRAGRVQREVDQPRFGTLVGTERDDARDAGLLRLLLQPRELSVVAVEHNGTVRLESGKDLRLGVGDRLDAGEEFQMHRLDRGDDGDVRPHHLHQRSDLAGMVHADLEHRKARARRAARQRQRHAPVIVERCDRGMGLALCR